MSQFENQLTTFPEILKETVLELLNDGFAMLDFNDTTCENNRILTVYLKKSETIHYYIVKYLYFPYRTSNKVTEKVTVNYLHSSDLERLIQLHEKQSV